MFADNLKSILLDKGMSQQELATKIGKGKSSVSQYISGKTVPREDVQKKIAEVLDCTVEFLNQGQIDPNEQRKISVAECAKILDKSEQFVRVALQTGVAPFGFAVKSKSRYDYHISPKKLYEYIKV